jgi:hypothetical protein
LSNLLKNIKFIAEKYNFFETGVGILPFLWFLVHTDFYCRAETRTGEERNSPAMSELPPLLLKEEVWVQKEDIHVTCVLLSNAQLLGF